MFARCVLTRLSDPLYCYTCNAPRTVSLVRRRLMNLEHNTGVMNSGRKLKMERKRRKDDCVCREEKEDACVRERERDPPRLEAYQLFLLTCRCTRLVKLPQRTCLGSRPTPRWPPSTSSTTTPPATSPSAARRTTAWETRPTNWLIRRRWLAGTAP